MTIDMTIPTVTQGEILHAMAQETLICLESKTDMGHMKDRKHRFHYTELDNFSVKIDNQTIDYHLWLVFRDIQGEYVGFSEAVIRFPFPMQEQMPPIYSCDWHRGRLDTALFCVDECVEDLYKQCGKCCLWFKRG